jgi:hypothetical protein
MNSEHAAFHFDAYIMVDWSANNSPKTGKDSIWYCVLERIDGVTRVTSIENPPTRHLAYNQISDVLKRLARRGFSTLVGFDFPYGYPRGFTDALKIRSAAPWKEVWKLLTSRVIDDERNQSNRFDVAAALNSEISGEPFPFWGCPSNQQRPFLTSRRAVSHRPDEIPEFRVSDKRIRGPQPIWKLCYPGSVGSQALVGIPYVDRLRSAPELSSISRVWPFETGFNLPSRMERGWKILHAEIYPSIITCRQETGMCKDQAQVRGLANYFADEDKAGRIADLFAVPPGLSPEKLVQIVAEEGWTLGVR